jgi:hypothetical protein
VGKDVVLACGCAAAIWHQYKSAGLQDKELRRHAEQLEGKHPTHEGSCRRAQERFASEQLQEYNSPPRDKAHFQPFDSSDALTAALRATLTSKYCRPGVIVVAAPKGAGKTSRVRQVCHDLVDENAIRGAVLLDFSKGVDVNARIHFWTKFGLGDNPLMLDIYDVIPRPTNAASSNAGVIIILDNIDSADSPSMLDLCQELMMASARGGHTPFYVVATCRDPVTASRVLNLNGGEKTRALWYGLTLVNGDPNAPSNSWAHRGLKWKKDDCERLVSAFEEREYHRLPDLVRDKLLDLAALAGTPRFIRDFFDHASTTNMLHSTPHLLASLDGPFAERADATKAEWLQMEIIKDPAIKASSKQQRLLVRPVSDTGSTFWPGFLNYSLSFFPGRGDQAQATTTDYNDRSTMSASTRSSVCVLFAAAAGE